MSKRVLIAEDEQVARELLSEFAVNHGYEVTAVSNGIDLLKAVTEKKFDVVITDLMMAGLDGVSAAKIMKFQDNTTPIIALTGVSEHDVLLVQDSFTRIYHKPVNAGELFYYVGTLLVK